MGQALIALDPVLALDATGHGGLRLQAGRLNLQAAVDTPAIDPLLKPS